MHCFSSGQDHAGVADARKVAVWKALRGGYPNATGSSRLVKLSKPDRFSAGLLRRPDRRAYGGYCAGNLPMDLVSGRLVLEFLLRSFVLQHLFHHLLHHVHAVFHHLVAFLHHHAHLHAAFVPLFVHAIVSALAALFHHGFTLLLAHHVRAYTMHRFHGFAHGLHVFLHEFPALQRIRCRMDPFHLLLHFLHLIVYFHLHARGFVFRNSLCRITLGRWGTVGRVFILVSGMNSRHGKSPCHDEPSSCVLHVRLLEACQMRLT